MPTSGWTMTGCCHPGAAPPGDTSRPSTVKNRPLRCTRLPVPSSNPQPSSASNGIRVTSKGCARARSASQPATSSVAIAAPSGAAADRASRSATDTS